MAQRTNSGWKLIKTLTPEETADARARMGLDEAGLLRSLLTDPPGNLDEAYALQARLEAAHQKAVADKRMADASRIRERLDDLAREHGL